MLVLAAAFAAPGNASAAAPCWKQVINDWLADGRIDRIYDDSCYARAIEELPQDLEDYSSLRDEIELAREAAQRNQLPPASGGGSGDEGEDGRLSPAPPFSDPGDGGTTGGAERDKGFLKSFLVKVGPKNADEVPLPLLVLGAIATLLIAAGAAGMVARKTSARRIQGHPQP